MNKSISANKCRINPLIKCRNDSLIIHILYNSALIDVSQCFVTDTDECVNNPCENNGTCVDLVNAYDCICLAGFNDTNCTTSTIK